ncbi:MAG: hypothetical protein U0871_00065 [Gemmataceae bacterium]
MPDRLPDRCRPDSIAEFREAALRRYGDGLALAETKVRERRTGAIYLWGYVVEMVLKAAVFEAFGYDVCDQISAADLHAIKGLAADLGLNWPKNANLHRVDLWGQVLVRMRVDDPAASDASLADADVLLARSVRVMRLWRETLRYHPDTAYDHEVQAVRQDCEWFLRWADDL